ncbi:MAG: plastocyanin/azurin family copper-binding protein [Actinomycetota bacterium]
MKARLLAALAVLALAAAACGGDDAPSGSNRTPTGGGTGAPTTPGVTPGGTSTTGGGSSGTVVTAADNLTFSPPSLTITRGTKVTWRNSGGLPHTVTFRDNSFDKPLPEGGSVEFTFDKPGTTKYFCKIHPAMEGDVQVS